MEELLKRPELIDHSQLESYLSDEDFTKVFAMSRDAFTAQPSWKQTDQRRNVGLY